MELVWTDDLAFLLAKEDGKKQSDLSTWISRPVAYRLPDDQNALTFAREMHEREDETQ